MTQPVCPATVQPSAIYVWLVPSEQVLEQPGSWRIRKWDTEPFPEANFALSETPSSPKEDVGPWRIVAENNGATLYSEDFEHDVAITIGGDFADTAQAIAYAENVAKRLGAIPPAIEQKPEWLVWSDDHRAWWGPDRSGYRCDVSEAGRYTLADARSITRVRSWDGGIPPETMIHEEDANRG